MAKLQIYQGQEFKLNISDSVDNTNIFYSEYQKAAAMLDDLLAGVSRTQEMSDTEPYLEYGNNIIAFCGDRGDGKSSAMMTFVEELKKDSKNRNHEKCNSFLHQYKNIQNTYFVNSVVIDPTLFDDAHSILDIILANLYKNFINKYSNADIRDEYKYARVIDNFQKVYKQVSLLNNQKKILDDEFDYEGDIGKLSRLGESTQLKKSLIQLLKYYLEYFVEEGKGNGKLLIAIDDLDLCYNNAYKMAEDIRKYLIIPNVVIVMAVKISQLEYCIKENNFKQFTGCLSLPVDAGKKIIEDINDMTERYIIKLLPLARRINMPKARDIDNVQIYYNGKLYGGENNRLSKNIIGLIQDKTGMVFTTESSGYSYLLPNRLRELVNIIVILLKMKNPTNDAEYVSNIITLYNGMIGYLAESESLLFDNQEVNINNIEALKLMNVNTSKFLENLYMQTIKKDELQQSAWAMDNQSCFYNIQSYFSIFRYNVYDMSKKSVAYKMSILYTFKLNELCHQNNDFTLLSSLVSEYIWGSGFDNVIPNSQNYQKLGISRGRFVINSIDAYNCILDSLNINDEKWIIDNSPERFRVPKISENSKSDEIIKVWFLIMLVSNFYSDIPKHCLISNGILIYNNSMINYNLSVCMENYIVGLCNLENVFRKMNYEFLGIKEDTVKDLVANLNNRNRRAIACARTICSNIDIMNELIVWCTTPKRSYKGHSGNDQDLSKKIFQQFLKNVVKYMKTKDVEIEIDDFLNLKYSENDTLDICDLLSKLFIFEEKRRIESGNQKVEDIDYTNRNIAAEIRKKLEEIPLKLGEPRVLSVSRFLKTNTAENAKKNLDNLLRNIQNHRFIYKEDALVIDTEAIVDFYYTIMKLYSKDPKNKLTKDLLSKYKEIVEVNFQLNLS
jgi:hypothetical protein